MDNEEKKLIEAYWERVKALCKEQGLTQAGLCEKTGIDLGKLKSQITNTVAPKAFDVQKTAAALGVSMEFLTVGTDGNPFKTKYEKLMEGIKALIEES